MNRKPEEQASAVPVIGAAVRLVSSVVDHAIANLVAQVNAVGVTAEDLLLDGSANDTLLRAEIERESSNFERAIQLCDKLLGMNADRHLIEIATLICARAIAKDERVFRR